MLVSLHKGDLLRVATTITCTCIITYRYMELPIGNKCPNVENVCGVALVQVLLVNSLILTAVIDYKWRHLDLKAKCTSDFKCMHLYACEYGIIF
jgi:hypothetical protein